MVGLEAGTDLAHFLAEHLPGDDWSVRAVRRFLADGRVTVDGAVETFGSRRLRRGEVVDFRLGDNERRTTRFETNRLVHDGDGLIAYDKPAGLAVTPTDGGKAWHLEKLLADQLGRVYPVHRLDADTSGLVVFARDQALAAALAEHFREHRVRKTYLAIVRGHPPETGRRQTYLVCKERQPGFEKWGTGRGPDAREAITTWELDERLGPFASLVRVAPETGRHHQIRIHFSEIGHPLYGDRVYGDRRDPVIAGRQMLHASELSLPLAGRTLHLRTRQPRDFIQLQKDLRKLK